MLKGLFFYKKLIMNNICVFIANEESALFFQLCLHCRGIYPGEQGIAQKRVRIMKKW
jgi:hypothetical protein